MADPVDSYRRLLNDLNAERQGIVRELERVDVEIAEVQLLMGTRQPVGPVGEGLIFLTPRQPNQASPPGTARREVLALMSDGEIWTPARMGRARGTHPNA